MNNPEMVQLYNDRFIQNALRVLLTWRCWRFGGVGRRGNNVARVRIWANLENRRQVVWWRSALIEGQCVRRHAMASHGPNGTVPPASSASKSDFLVNGKYRLVRKIGSGSFGEIYLGINVSSGEVRFRHKLAHVIDGEHTGIWSSRNRVNS